MFYISLLNCQVLDGNDVDAVVRYVQSEKCKNIIVMAGAGISTCNMMKNPSNKSNMYYQQNFISVLISIILAAGIPDFRSPGSGLYANIMKKYQLPDPQVMFEIGFFKKHPEPFYSLAKELFPEELRPTPSHYFVKLLHNKGYLLRHYTQVTMLN